MKKIKDKISFFTMILLGCIALFASGLIFHYNMLKKQYNHKLETIKTSYHSFIAKESDFQAKINAIIKTEELTEDNMEFYLLNKLSDIFSEDKIQSSLTD